MKLFSMATTSKHMIPRQLSTKEKCLSFIQRWHLFPCICVCVGGSVSVCVCVALSESNLMTPAQCHTARPCNKLQQTLLPFKAAVLAGKLWLKPVITLLAHTWGRGRLTRHWPAPLLSLWHTFVLIFFLNSPQANKGPQSYKLYFGLCPK